MAYEPTLDEVLNSIYGPETDLTEEELAQYLPEPYTAPQYTPQGGGYAPAPIGREVPKGRVTTAANKSLSPTARALLDTIAGDESPDYRTIYGGKKVNDLSWHPGVAVPIRGGPNAGKTSSAAGRYQFLGSTWNDQAKKLGLQDFSPESQDLAAWNLALESYGPSLEADLQSGDPNKVAAVGRALRKVWTSLPGGIEQGAQASKFASRYFSNLGAESGSPQTTPQTAPQESPYQTIKLSDGTTVDVEPGADLTKLAEVLKTNGIEAEPLRQVSLPDGSFVDAPLSYSDEQVLQGMRKLAPDAFGEQPKDESDKKGVLPAMISGAESAFGSMARGAGAATEKAGQYFESPLLQGAGRAAAEEGREWQQKAAERYQELTPEEAKQIGMWGTVRKEFVEPLASGVGSIGATLPAFMIPGVGMAAGVGAIGAQEIGGELAEQERMGQTPDVTKTLGPAAVSTAVNVAGMRFLGPLKGLLGEFASPSAQAYIKDIVAKEGVDAASKAIGSRLSNIAKETGLNVVGVGTGEVASRIAERVASDQPINTPEALAEYEDVFLKSAPLGVVSGGLSGAGRYAAKKGTVEEAQLAQRQAELEAQRAAEAEQAEVVESEAAKKQAAEIADLERKAGIGVGVRPSEEPAVASNIPPVDTTVPPVEPQEPPAQPTIPTEELPTASVPPTAPAAPTVEVASEEIPEPTVRQPEPKHWAEDTLGLPPKAGVVKKIKAAGLEVDNPADHEAITDILNKSTARIAPEAYTRLEERMSAVAPKPEITTPEVPSAQRVQEPAEVDVGGKPQPEIRQEGRGTPEGGEGVRVSRPEVRQVEEIKIPEGIKVEALPNNRFRITGVDLDAAQQTLISAKIPKGSRNEELGGLEFNNKVRDKVLGALQPQAEAIEVEAVKAPKAEAPKVEAPEVETVEVEAVKPLTGTIPTLATLRTRLKDSPAYKQISKTEGAPAAKKWLDNAVIKTASQALQIAETNPRFSEEQRLQVRKVYGPTAARLSEAPKVEATEAPAPSNIKPQEAVEAWDNLRTADQPDFASLSKPAQKLWKDEYRAYEGMVDKDAVADVVKFDAGEKETVAPRVVEVEEAPKKEAVPSWEKPEVQIRRMGPAPSWTTPEALVRRMGPAPAWEKPEATTRRMGPAPKWEKPETAIRKMGPAPNWEKPSAENKKTGIPDWAQGHADDLGGSVLHHKDALALVQGFSILNGRPVFAGAKGGSRTRVDIESYTGNLFTPEEKAELVAAKKKWVEEDEKAYAANPDGPFKKGEKFAASENVPKEIQEIAKRWQDMLGMGERIYLTTVGDTKTAKHAGPFAAIPSQGLNPNEFGSKRRLANGDFVIAYRPSARTSQTLETISHEMGHALMDTRYKDASPEVRKALDADYEKWFLSTKGKTGRELVESLRAHTTGKLTGVPKGAMADEMSQYWKSHSEWFADQVSRWATTDKKPLGVVEQFFSKLAQAMKRFFLANRQYLPTKNMRDWLNSLGETYVEPSKKEPGKIDTSLQQARAGEEVTPKESKPLVKETEPKERSALRKGMDAAADVIKSGAWTRLETSLIDKNAALREAIKDKSTFDMNGKLRADLVGSAYDQIFNVITAGATEGFPVFSTDGTIMIRKDDKLNPSNILKATDKLKVKNPRAYVGFIARVLNGEAILKEDKEIMKRIDELRDKAKKLNEYAKTQSFKEGKVASDLAEKYTKQVDKLQDKLGEEGREKLVTADDIAEAKRRLAEHPEIQPILDDIRGLLHSLVDLWDGKLINKETANKWKENPFYIPQYASEEDLLRDPSKTVRMMGGGAKSLPNVKALKGGTHAINLFENLQRHYAFMTTAAAQNATRKTAARDMELFGAARRTSRDDKQAIMFKEDGKEIYYRIDDPVAFDAFQAAAPLMNPLMKAAREYTKVFRAVTLINPLYWYRQLIRDPLHANVVSKTGMVTPIGATLSFVKIIAGASKEYGELKRRGAVGAIDALSDPARFKKISDKNPGLFKKGADWVMRVHEAADAATRVEVYKAALKEAKKKGMSREDAENYATMRAREIINFANQGRSNTLQSIRATVPFFSAQLNSLDSVARAATGKGLNRREAAEARRLFVSRALMIASYTTAYALAMQDDEDYLDSPDSVNNWLIPTGKEDSPFAMIPIPFELGFFLKVLPELMVRLNSGTLRPSEAKKMAKEAAWSTLTPPLPFPQLIKPLAEAATNTDFHTGRAIVGAGQARLTPTEQTRGASSLSIELGRSLGLSPIQIEHFGRGYLTELWTVMGLVADKFLEEGQGKPAKYPGEVPIIMGGAKGILTKPERDRDVDTFFELNQAVGAIRDTVTRAQGRGNVDTMERLMADPENKKKFYAAPAGREIAEEMSKVEKAIDQIQNDKSLTPERKQIAIRDRRKWYNELASRGVKRFYSLDIEE
jgi:muramidase (phage lysozyme)